MIYVYILQSGKNGSYYIGHTANINDRFHRHNSGQSLATKSKRPWKLVYIKQFETRVDASRYERQIKKEKSRRYIENLIKRGVAQLPP